MNSRRGNLQLATDYSRQRIGNFAMAWHWRATSVRGVLKDRVAVAFANQYATVAFQMPNQVATLHGAGTVRSCKLLTYRIDIELKV